MAVMGATLRATSKAVVIPISVFNRSVKKTEEVIAENYGKLVPHPYTVKEFVES